MSAAKAAPVAALSSAAPVVEKKPVMPAASIELFQKEECPYSHSVRNRLTELGIDFVAHPVPAGNEQKHRELVKAGGRDQIPFLIDHSTGAKLYESEAILNYLDEHYGDGQKRRSAFWTRADRLQWLAKTPISQFRRYRQQAMQSVQDSLETLRGAVRIFQRGQRGPRK